MINMEGGRWMGSALPQRPSGSLTYFWGQASTNTNSLFWFNAIPMYGWAALLSFTGETSR